MPILIRRVEFFIVNANTPFLLSLADINKLKVYLNNIKNMLVQANGSKVPVIRRFRHLFILWYTTQLFITESFSINPCFLTDAELKRLYC